jgi:multimeric flavodoxin WrbA
MKKVTAFVGSAHKGNTHKAVGIFLDHLKAQGEVETEIVTLSNYKLGICRGCRLCFSKGEEFCPLKDDRDVLMEKIMASDGVVFATPNYMFQLSGLMKIFLDRFGFLGHRPRFFGKAFTSIVTQGFGGGNKIVEYLDSTAPFLGFNVVKGSCVTALAPWSEKDQRKIDKTLAAHSRRFYAGLAKPAYPVPSLYMLMGFRMGRNAVHQELDDTSYDYRYYAENGWFESDYFYPTHLGLFKKQTGHIFDRMSLTIRKLMAVGG